MNWCGMTNAVPHGWVRTPKWPFWLGYGLLMGMALLIILLGPFPLPTGRLALSLASLLMGMAMLACPYWLEWQSQRTQMHNRMAAVLPLAAKAAEQSSVAIERLRVMTDETLEAITAAKRLPESMRDATATLALAWQKKESNEIERLRAEAERNQTLLGQRLAEMAESLSQTRLEAARLIESIHNLPNVSRAGGDEPGFAKAAAPDPAADLVKALEPVLAAQMAQLTSELAGQTAAFEKAAADLRKELLRYGGAIRAATAALSAASTHKPTGVNTPLVGAGQDLPENNSRSAPGTSAAADGEKKEEHLPGEHEAILMVEAMVGITNKLYLRGDGPFLSWDKGTPLELVGIGKWKWSVTGIKKPLQCAVYRNDEEVAKGSDILLTPGKLLTVRAVFSTELNPHV